MPITFHPSQAEPDTGPISGRSEIMNWFPGTAQELLRTVRTVRTAQELFQERSQEWPWLRNSSVPKRLLTLLMYIFKLIYQTPLHDHRFLSSENLAPVWHHSMAITEILSWGSSGHVLPRGATLLKISSSG